ncbi:MAG: hypothetical protein HZA51_12815 [Planctomycetes bacterium]|nr:hypothetical protein [Planctomycetota bacterium]
MATSVILVLFAASVSGCGWSPAVPVTRADLGDALMRFERAYEAAPPLPEKLEDVNLRFDRATQAFFTFNYSAIMQSLDAILQGPLAAKAFSDSARAAASLKGRVSPRVFVKGTTSVVTARVTSCYELSFATSGSVPLKLRLTPVAGGPAIVEASFAAPVSSSTRVDVNVPITLDPGKVSPGAYYIDVATADGMTFHAGRWSVVSRELNGVRDENSARLDAITSEAPAILQAVAVCKARNELLVDTPSEDRLIEYLTDPAAIAAQLETEIAALEQGGDPYLRRRGDYWRVFKTDSTEIPARVYVPTTLNLDQPVPLVVAFHGAGGDENMFPDGYGAGKIKTLADQHGFVLVSPLAYPLLSNPMLFDKILTLTGYDYPIDTSRVFVVGHSLGAVTTGRICVERRALVTAAICMAGAGDLAVAKDLPPMRIYGAEVDQIAQTARVREQATAAKDRGLPVEYREKADYGHTILVGAAIPEAVDWLFAQSNAKRGMGERAKR